MFFSETCKGVICKNSVSVINKATVINSDCSGNTVYYFVYLWNNLGGKIQAMNFLNWKLVQIGIMPILRWTLSTVWGIFDINILGVGWNLETHISNIFELKWAVSKQSNGRQILQICWWFFGFPKNREYRD
jgi:hypothetical protein